MGNRLRSLENNGTVAGPNQLDGLVESRSARSNNTVNNIYPYGNVPLSMLQQIPADIKVGSGNNNNNKRPSFYQWPLVGASQAANFLFGTNGRARFKSLGGGGSRKYEPQGQLTPPSLQQLQQASSKENPPERPRRPYFRRGSNQPQPMTPEEQNKAEYYLLRQQQLHLQQQQLLQANRMMWGSQPVRGQSPAFVFQQQQQQQQQSPALTPNQWVLTPPQPQASPPQWRPDAVVVETETSRYPSALLPLSNSPDIQSSLATDQVQVVRNQPSFGTPIRSSILPHSDLLAPSSVSVVVNTQHSIPPAQPLAPSGVTLETMTVSNTLSNTPIVRVPTIENQGVPHTTVGDLVQIEADGADLLQSASIQQSLSTEDPILSLVPAAQTVNLLLNHKSPSSNRQTINDSQLPANVTGELTVDEIVNSTALFNQSTINASSISTTKDVFIRDNPIAATIWSDYAFVSDSSNNGADELYPNPSQLGQARDEYWSNKATASNNNRGRQMSFPVTPESPPLVGVGVAAAPYYTQYAASAVRPPRLLVNQAQHQPLYIPISPFQVADRQNRKLQPQYYADSSSNNNNKPVTPAEPVVFAAGNQRAGTSIPQ